MRSISGNGDGLLFMDRICGDHRLGARQAGKRNGASSSMEAAFQNQSFLSFFGNVKDVTLET
jgi:hypothetical protein